MFAGIKKKTDFDTENFHAFLFPSIREENIQNIRDEVPEL